MAGALGLLSVACLSLAAASSGGGPALLQLDGQCTQPYTTLADAWRSVGNVGGAGGSAGDVLSNSSGCHMYTATGVGDAWYRFAGGGGDALALLSPCCGHCGSDRRGWLSAWAPAGGAPPSTSYGAAASYPAAAAGIVSQTVCFEDCDKGHAGTCRDHRTVQVVNCTGYLLWQLPPAPDCACVYCTAPSVTPAPPPQGAPPRVDKQPWSGPALALRHTSPGGFPALELEVLQEGAQPGRVPGASPPIPPFWLNLNNQGYPNVTAIVRHVSSTFSLFWPL